MSRGCTHTENTPWSMPSWIAIFTSSGVIAGLSTAWSIYLAIFMPLEPPSFFLPYMIAFERPAVKRARGGFSPFFDTSAARSVMFWFSIGI